MSWALVIHVIWRCCPCRHRCVCHNLCLPMRVLSNCVVPRHSLRAVCYRPVINFFLALAMSQPVIVSPSLTREAFNLPTHEPEYRGRISEEPGDWVIADHEHPAFGKSAFQFVGMANTCTMVRQSRFVTQKALTIICDPGLPLFGACKFKS